MGLFSPSYTWHQNPNIAGTSTPFGGGYQGLESWAANQGLGKAGHLAKQGLKALAAGDYSGIAGSYLAPIENEYATNEREADRNLSMGANAFVQGAQPALMANIGQTAQRQMAEGEGEALAQAIPQLYSQFSNTFQNAHNAMTSDQLAALSAALQARANSGTLTANPSKISDIGQIVNLGQGIASDIVGFGKLGGSFGGVS